MKTKASKAAAPHLAPPTEEALHARLIRSPLHIMVVDNDPQTHALVKTLFSSRYCVSRCEDVQEAVQEYMHTLPDLLFLSIGMGDAAYNGLDALSELLMRDAAANIVMLTGPDSPRNIGHSAHLSAFGFIPKPLQPEPFLHYAEACEYIKSRKGTLA